MKWCWAQGCMSDGGSEVEVRLGVTRSMEQSDMPQNTQLLNKSIILFYTTKPRSPHAGTFIIPYSVHVFTLQSLFFTEEVLACRQPSTDVTFYWEESPDTFHPYPPPRLHFRLYWALGCLCSLPTAQLESLCSLSLAPPAICPRLSYWRHHMRFNSQHTDKVAFLEGTLCSWHQQSLSESLHSLSLSLCQLAFIAYLIWLLFHLFIHF